MKKSRDGSIHVTDEILNTAFHSAAAFFTLVGGSMLIAKAALLGDPWKITSFSVYSFTLLLLFVSSAMHHGLKCGAKTENFLRSLDYSSIFLLIAGSLTPISLVILRDTPYGWVILGVCWFTALAGAAVRILIPGIPRWFTTTLFISMGWSVVFIVVPFAGRAGLAAVLYLGAGGIFYTAGSVIFTIEKPNPVKGIFGFHEIWHLFVIAGSVMHYILMYTVVLPY
ncbi:MAG: hemolysin III family protein [Spirochaetia bacterium]|jgi:hemolysin III|nr:hemolysin III family protein [Spirochaetia bacterium]